MTRKLPWVLLALSITFNFAFTGGLLEAQSAKEAAVEPEQTPGDKAHLVADKLGLNAEQRQAYIDARTRLSNEGAELREAMALAGEERRAELAKARPDLARVAEIEADIADYACRMRLLAAECMGQFAGRLGPEQRRLLGGMMRRRGRHDRPLPPPLRRFDTDGDGRLSEAERQAARRRFHGMRQGREGEARSRPGFGGGQVRDELLRRYDADGDGVLSEAERAEMIRARRQWEGSTRPAPKGGGWRKQRK